MAGRFSRVSIKSAVEVCNGRFFFFFCYSTRLWSSAWQGFFGPEQQKGKTRMMTYRPRPDCPALGYFAQPFGTNGWCVGSRTLIKVSCSSHQFIKMFMFAHFLSAPSECGEDERGFADIFRILPHLGNFVSLLASTVEIIAGFYPCFCMIQDCLCLCWNINVVKLGFSKPLVNSKTGRYLPT